MHFSSPFRIGKCRTERVFAEDHNGSNEVFDDEVRSHQDAVDTNEGVTDNEHDVKSEDQDDGGGMSCLRYSVAIPCHPWIKPYTLLPSLGSISVFMQDKNVERSSERPSRACLLSRARHRQRSVE